MTTPQIGTLADARRAFAVGARIRVENLLHPQASGLRVVTRSQSRALVTQPIDEQGTATGRETWTDWPKRGEARFPGRLRMEFLLERDGRTEVAFTYVLVPTPPASFTYGPWRHGGWYVENVRYSSGAVGCVSRNFTDKKWRIVCDPRGATGPGDPDDHTYPSRDAAAAAEWQLIQERGL